MTAGTDTRTRDREREARDRQADPRDVFAAHLDLPRGQERELVLEGREQYELNRDDLRTLSTFGAFRVVPEHQLPDGRDHSLVHLRDEGLIRSVSVNANERIATLTERGRDLLESHRRDREDGRDQSFHADVSRMRELSHDAKRRGSSSGNTTKEPFGTSLTSCPSAFRPMAAGTCSCT